MHYTSTQPNDGEYPARQEEASEPVDSGRRPGNPDDKLQSRMNRKSRRLSNRQASSAHQDSVAGGMGSSERYYSNDSASYAGHTDDTSGFFGGDTDEGSTTSAKNPTGRRQSRRAARTDQNSVATETTDAELFIDELQSFKPATRRGSKWREWLIARHSVTESGFPVFAGMRPVVAFLLIPGLIVLGITLTGGHWPKGVLYPLAFAMGLYVLFSAFRGVELVLAVLLFYVPFSPVYVIPLAPGINGTNSLIALGLLATFIQSRNNSISLLNWRKGTTLIIVYAVLTTLSGVTIAVFEPDGYHYLMGDEFHNYKGWIEQFLIYFIALSCIRDHATAKRVFFYMVVGSVLVVIYTLPEMYSKFGLSSIEKSRVNGPLEQANEFGGLLAYTMMLSGGLFLAYIRTIRAWIAAPYFLLALKLLISTFSRGAYLALAGGGLIAGYLRGKFFVAAWGVGAVLFLAIFPQFIPESIIARLNHSVAQTESTSAPQQLDKSSEHRLILWKAAADMTLESPILGKGFKGFQKLKHLYTERPVHEKDPHNYYLYVASQMGLPALVVFLFILMFAFSMGWRLSKHTDDTYIRAVGIAGASSVATYAAVCMFGSRAVNPEFTAYFWVMVVCMQVLISSDDPHALSNASLKNEERRRRIQSVHGDSQSVEPDLPKRIQDDRASKRKNRNQTRSNRVNGRVGKNRTNAFEVARATATDKEQAVQNRSAGDAANAVSAAGGGGQQRQKLTHHSSAARGGKNFRNAG